MNVLVLPVQHKSQTQRAVVMLETTARSSVCDHMNSREEESQSAKACPEPFDFAQDKLRRRVKTQKSKVNDFPLTPDPQSPTLVLTGRGPELAQLHSLFAKALAGERQIIFVTGEAGIGKTTLVDVFLAQIRHRDDVRITSGQCVEQYGPGEAYLPLLEATARLCRGPGHERRIEGLRRYAPSCLVQLPGLLDSEDCTLLQERVQGTSRERMLREMAEAAELFTTQRGLVLVLEDLHWSDVSTLEWLSYMAQRREPAKLLILATYRPTDLLSRPAKELGRS